MPAFLFGVEAVAYGGFVATALAPGASGRARSWNADAGVS